MHVCMLLLHIYMSCVHVYVYVCVYVCLYVCMCENSEEFTHLAEQKDLEYRYACMYVVCMHA
jgi:hypothetical protein